MAVEDDRTVVVSRAAQSGLPGAWDEDQYGDEYGGIEGSESLPQRRTATGG
jgi:hypothetical protein